MSSRYPNNNAAGPVAVPLGYPTALFYVDESAAKSTGGSFFVIGAVKLRDPGALMRTIRDIRDRWSFEEEFKFTKISRGKLPVFCELVDAVAASDAHLAACVVDRTQGQDPFRRDEPDWLAHARLTAKLIVGAVNRRELAGALLDHVSTPRGDAFDDTVRRMVNTRLRATSLISAACVDSKSNDGVQVADLVAGAVALQRREQGGTTNPNSHKSKISQRLAAAFGVSSFEDCRTDRVNILTVGRQQAALPIPRQSWKSPTRRS